MHYLHRISGNGHLVCFCGGWEDSQRTAGNLTTRTDTNTVSGASGRSIVSPETTRSVPEAGGVMTFNIGGGSAKLAFADAAPTAAPSFIAFDASGERERSAGHHGKSGRHCYSTPITGNYAFGPPV